MEEMSLGEWNDMEESGECEGEWFGDSTEMVLWWMWLKSSLRSLAYCKTLIFRCILISCFWSVENLRHFNFVFLLLTAFCLSIFSWHPLLLPLCVKWLHVVYMKMWKWNVNSVVLLYKYFELAIDKSTEIKTSFLGLEPCNTDTTILFNFTARRI